MSGQAPLSADRPGGADEASGSVAGSIGRASHLPLHRRAILVVEDEYLIAEDLAAVLKDAGAEVMGPAESLPQAIRLAQNCGTLDCALLDIDLQGVAVYPLAEQLRASAVPMLFLTGMGCQRIPAEFMDIPCLAKPTGSGRVVEALAVLIGPHPAIA